MENTFTYTQNTAFTSKAINEFRILFGKEYQPTRSLQAAPKIVVLDSFGAQADRLQTEYHTTFHDALSSSTGRAHIENGYGTFPTSPPRFGRFNELSGNVHFSTLQDYLEQSAFCSFNKQARARSSSGKKCSPGFFILDDIQVRPI